MRITQVTNQHKNHVTRSISDDVYYFQFAGLGLGNQLKV